MKFDNYVCENQSSIEDFIPIEPVPCTCGRIPKLHERKTNNGKTVYSYICDCGMWQNHCGSFVAFESQKLAVTDWNKQKHKEKNELYLSLKNATCEIILQNIKASTVEEMKQKIKEMIVCDE